MAKLKDTLAVSTVNLLDAVTVASSTLVNGLVVVDSWLSELYNADSTSNADAMAKHKATLLGKPVEKK